MKYWELLLVMILLCLSFVKAAQRAGVKNALSLIIPNIQ